MIPFLGPIFTGIGSLASGAASLAGGAVSSIGGALGSTAGFLGETAIGAGGSVLSGIGKLAGGIFETPAGFVSGAGQTLFGGQDAVSDYPVLDPGGEMGLTKTVAGGGLFSNLSLDTLSDVAELGYSIYMTQEQMKLAEKALEAQRKAGYVVGAPGTTLAPTTRVTVPAGTVAGQAPGLFQADGGAKLITYAIIAVVAYFILKGFK